MRLITLYLPEPDLETLAELVRRKRYPNRSEAIRIALRNFVIEELEMLRRMDSKRSS